MHLQSPQFFFAVPARISPAEWLKRYSDGCISFSIERSFSCIACRNLVASWRLIPNLPTRQLMKSRVLGTLVVPRPLETPGTTAPKVVVSHGGGKYKTFRCESTLVDGVMVVVENWSVNAPPEDDIVGIASLKISFRTTFLRRIFEVWNWCLNHWNLVEVVREMRGERRNASKKYRIHF